MENSTKTTKITKAMVLDFIKANVGNMIFEETGVTAEDVTNYVDVTLGQLEAKNVKAAERRAKAKADGDELREVIKSVLTTEYQSRDAIFKQIDGGDDLTVNKVGARLTQLVESGEAEKDTIKVGDRKIMGYRLTTTTDAE